MKDGFLAESKGWRRRALQVELMARVLPIRDCNRRLRPRASVFMLRSWMAEWMTRVDDRDIAWEQTAPDCQQTLVPGPLLPLDNLPSTSSSCLEVTSSHSVAQATCMCTCRHRHMHSNKHTHVQKDIHVCTYTHTDTHILQHPEPAADTAFVLPLCSSQASANLPQVHAHVQCQYPEGRKPSTVEPGGAIAVCSASPGNPSEPVQI